MSALYQEDPDPIGISFVRPTVFPLSENLSQMTKLWDNIGQLPTFEMQANKPDLHTCLYDEGPPNLQKEQEIAPEVPISMNVTLPPCWVVLHRLTEEQIYQRYPDDCYDNQVNDLDEYLTQRSLRKLQKTDDSIFELYKRRRKRFLNRQASILERFGESEDMSQDEYKPSGRGRKQVKRVKKKYEQDSEWSPHTETISVQGKRLRRQVRRPIIESSSDDDFLENYYANFDYDYDYLESNFSDSTSQNSVPSKSSHDSNIEKKSAAESLLKVNDECSDVVSGIIREMDAFQKESNNMNTAKFIQKPRLEISVKQKSPRGRKRLKLRHNPENDVTSVVTDVIHEMINTICTQQKQLEAAKNKIYRICKWCHTQFSANNINELMCAICCDLGKDKYLNTTTKTHNKSVTKSLNKTEKDVSVNKIPKKGNSLSSQIFKTMPKHEKNRLMYTEKSSKLSNEKGYNHCKSFNTPKNELLNDVSKNQLGESSASSDASLKKKSKNNQKKNNLQENQPKTISTSVSTPSPQNISAKDVNTKQETTSQGKNKVLLKKHENGLFLIDFPEPDCDINIGTQNNKTNPKKRGRPSKFNGSSATHIEKKTVTSSEDKLLNSAAKDDSYQTYLLPPVPTVLVANYTSTDDNSGNYRLCSIFYQNEFTQQHSTRMSTNTPCISKSSQDSLSVSVSNNNLVIAPSNNNSGISSKQIEPLVKNASHQNSQLPIVSSVVSLHGQISSEDDHSLFIDPNFINSEQLSIRITHVASENSSIENTDNGLLSGLNKLENNSSVENMESNASKPNLLQSTEKFVSNDQTSETEPDKVPKNSEIQVPKNTIKSAIDLLGAVSALAVFDLHKNPRVSLQARMQLEKNNITKLMSEKNSCSDYEEKYLSYQCNLEVLEIAQKLLNIYGCFSKVSDYLLRKHKMMQIKKEKIDDDDEEETNQSSCRFSQLPSPHNLNMHEIPTLPSPLTSRVGNSQSCALQEQAPPNHIEKIQSQIAAMNNAQANMNNFTHYDVPNTGTVHHFAMDQYVTLTPTIGAPAPVTPRNDCIVTEPRETPSRGSGPRTPARPESATSQPDEQAITAQIKKELMEVGNSTSTPQFYSSNTTLTDVSSQMPAAQGLTQLNVGQSYSNNTVQQFNVNNSNNGLFQNNPPAYNQDCSNILLNIAQRNQVSPNVTATLNTNIDRNTQLLVRQYIPNTSGVQPNQTVPSVNNQRYVLRPPNSNNPNKTILVNSSQIGGQNMNGLLTNVSNQQFYTNNQVYYTNQSPVGCIQTNVPAQSALVASNQASAIETAEQMYCAVCKRLATLRCKQCAKVAYCNTTCAKTYWHQKHKMECKPL